MNTNMKKAKTNIGANKAELRHEWDLKPLFRSNIALDKFLITLSRKAKAFAKRYEGHLNEVKPNAFESVIIEYEQILEGFARVMTYVFLCFAKDTTQGDFYAKYELEITKLQNLVLFFEIEFCKLEKSATKAIISHTPKYAYYLQRLLERDSYQLSLLEEKVLLATSPLGVSAFSRLFDEHLANLSFKAPKALQEKQKNDKNKKDKGAKISEEEILSLLHYPKRIVRKQAQKIFTNKLKKSRHLLAFILNMVRKDVSINMNLRGYKLPESARHLSNDATQKSVDKLVEVVNAHFSIVQEYYALKASLLGLKELKDYDRYAPIDTKNYEMPYSQALRLVLKSFDNFHPSFKQIVQKALRKGWVDSHPAAHKRGGAFSHGSVPSAHPFVLLNYTKSRRDVFTIAHEFGHLIHQELSKTQGYINMDTPLTTAETASVFGEMLLFDTLKSTLPKSELIGLYAGKLEDIFSTLFRQIVMTNFERAIHSANDELKPEGFDRIWREENEKMFGKSLELSSNYDGWWCYIPHFVHSPFYCYAYAYGQLLVLTLFGLYKSQKTPKAREKFIQKYIEFLSAGGSKSPAELVKAFNLNLESDKFWLIGMVEVRKMLEEFKGLINAKNPLTPAL